MPLPGPETRVVELRVPGLIGTTGESLLDSVGVVDVAGDRLGRVIRPSDRLRRPAPGPVLQGAGRALPRTLEGYLWSGMTSGGVAKATWALLFPFSLANVAFWMLPPVPRGGGARARSARVIGAACRSLLRVAGLLLTTLLVSQLAVVTVDLLAAQCLAYQGRCVPSGLSWLSEVEALRTAVGLLPVALAIFVLHQVSGTEWAVSAKVSPRRPGRSLPGDELRAEDGVPVLRCLHTVAALACTALLLAGGPFTRPAATAEAVAWAAALGLLGVAVLATAVRMGRVFGRIVRAVLLGAAAGLLVWTAVLRTPLPPRVFGTDDTVQAIGAGLIVVCVLFALLLVPAALLARPAWRALPRRLRPWVGGWIAAPALALAGLIGGGFGAGLAIALRELVRTDLLLPPSYTLVTILWGAGLALSTVLAVLGFAVAVPMRRLRRGIPEVVRMLQAEEENRQEAATAWAQSSWERRYLHQIVVAVALGMAAGVAGLLVARFGFGGVPPWLEPLSGVGVVALGALAAGLLRVIYTAATTSERSRHLGALADLVSFWPRAAHPAVPPCYALKVVPELIERCREHLADPHTRVVLAGYHLGGLLAVIAAGRLAAELPPEDRERVGLLTAGSPLQWGYQRAFPAVLPHEALVDLYGNLNGRWRGLCRGTDTFGGGATTWRHQVVDRQLLGVGYLPSGGVGPLAPAEQGPTGALVLGGDHWLPDPMRGPLSGRRWAAGVRRHADYVTDPEWDRAVAMAAGLDRPDGPPPLAEQVALFPDLFNSDPVGRREPGSGGAAANTEQHKQGGSG
ncbi:hypothetical protein [Amycolatopsis cihanbeyliensis]|uniref:Lipase (Class 3) n=1 Tax=Amycolatopsis cihanbeyliensis TaxID=1128664 RepID=A0A542DHP3_AMYCI|nr:hypothetical protein [Amycolatopsis cihanbeyliensis]TQJ02556.1 hypothetical protein FB471_2288 [Amycolatopsis cihanbeyliensis]